MLVIFVAINRQDQHYFFHFIFSNTKVLEDEMTWSKSHNGRTRTIIPIFQNVIHGYLLTAYSVPGLGNTDPCLHKSCSLGQGSADYYLLDKSISLFAVINKILLEHSPLSLLGIVSVVFTCCNERVEQRLYSPKV